MEQQTTIKSTITLSGCGLHTGAQVSVTLRPACANQGIIFRRIDLDPMVDIPARAEYVSDTSRGTTLSIDNVRVATIEHLMSALHGMSVDNVIAEVTGEEIPILDGSARFWVDSIKNVGLDLLPAERRYYSISETINYVDPKDSNIEYTALPADDFKVTTLIDFKSAVIGKQIAEMDGFEKYTTDVANCRTFVFLHEIAPLLDNNLIKGGALDNALIFVDHPLESQQAERLAKIYNKDVASLKVDNGVLNSVKPYFRNEPARHKMLDFIGDIYLTGIRLKGHFIIKCPGHKANTNFAQILSQTIFGNK